MQPTTRQLLNWFAIAGAAWALGCVYNVYGGGETTWLRSMYQRKVALAQEIEAPKIIVTGGSGAHYTIDSDVLEQELGMPVINLGIDGPVGLNIILPSVLPQVKEGDKVLLIPEYLLLHQEQGLGDRSGPFALATGQPFVGSIPPAQLTQDLLALGVPSLRGVIKSATDIATQGKVTGYYDDPLTENGDPTVEKSRDGEWWKMTLRKPATSYSLDRIAQFKAEVEARGGELWLALPWIYADANDPKTLETIQAIAADLSSIAPLVYNPDTLNIQGNSDLFADTHYHLSPEARRLRSQELIEQLEPYIN
jgi:hypothetical protein